MGILVLPKSSPAFNPGYAEINWGHPLAQGLTFALDTARGGAGNLGAVDLVSMAPPNLQGGTVQEGPTPYGDGINFASSNPNLSWACDLGPAGPLPPLITTMSYLSVFCLFRTSNTAAYGNWLTRDDGALGSVRVWIFRKNTSNVADFEVWNNSGTLQTIAGSTNIADGGWHSALGVFDGAHLNLYVDGHSDATATALSGTLQTSTTWQLNVGWHRGAGEYFIGTIAAAYIWGRPLTASEAQWLHAEPFAMLKRSARGFSISLPPPAGRGRNFAVIIG